MKALGKVVGQLAQRGESINVGCDSLLSLVLLVVVVTLLFVRVVLEFFTI